jgi:hypothetical protein
MCERRGWTRDINTSDPHSYWRLLVDDQHNVLYCVVPKVACSSFKTFIANSTGNTTKNWLKVHSVNFLKSIGLRYLNQPIFGVAKHRLDNVKSYYKFLAVRHPFDRLVSAYRDKFITGTYFPKMFHGLFRKVYKDQVPYDQYGVMRPTFSQFLGLIVRFYYLGFNDRHWQSYYDLCHPCDVHYDDVIKLETLGNDLHLVTERYSRSAADVTQVFPTLNHNRTSDTDKLSETSELFSHVHPAIIKQLMDIYEKDFVLFGYSWSHKHGAGCDRTKTKGGQTTCC